MDMHKIDPDKILLKLGHWAPYQIFVVTLLSTVWIFMAFQAMSWAFIGLFHPHTCVDAFNITTPIIYDMSCTTPSGLMCFHDANATLVYDPSFGSTLISEFELSCERYTYAQLGTTIYTAGGLLSSIIFAQLSDSFGRKWVVLVSWWASILLTLIRVITPTYLGQMILYVLLGATTTGVTTVGWVLCCEMVTAKARGFYTTASANLIWVVGYMLQGLAAMYIPQWRSMILWANLPWIWTIAAIWVVPESLHWLVAEKYYDRAAAWINRAAKWNCRSDADFSDCLRDEVEEEEHEKHDEGTGAVEDHPRRTVLDVLRTPVLMFHGLVCCFNGIVGMLIYWALSLFSTQMSDDRFIGYFLSGLVEIPAGLMGPLLLLWIGRKTLTIASMLISAVGFLARFLLPTDAPVWAALLTYLVAKYGNIMFFPGNFLIQSEVFPTTVRNLGFGVLGMLSTAGSMSAPFVGALLTSNPPLGSAIFTGLCLISAAITLVLPETKDKELPEDLKDVELGPFLSLFCKKGESSKTHESSDEKRAALIDK